MKIRKKQAIVGFVDKPEDVEMQAALRLRANYSLAVLGESFVWNGSGKFLNIRHSGFSLKHHISKGGIVKNDKR